MLIGAGLALWCQLTIGLPINEVVHLGCNGEGQKQLHGHEAFELVRIDCWHFALPYCGASNVKYQRVVVANIEHVITCACSQSATLRRRR